MGAKILVVEDDKDISRNLQKLFESEGYKVTTAYNGQTALDALASSSELPCVIFLDLMMPVMDGFQFREAQKRDSRISQIPVVIMSAHGQLDEKKAQLNATAALKKPTDIDVILDVVTAICPH